MDGDAREVEPRPKSRRSSDSFESESGEMDAKLFGLRGNRGSSEADLGSTEADRETGGMVPELFSPSSSEEPGRKRGKCGPI